MKKDILFTLQGDFMNGLEGPFFCPECIPLEGVLSYFPLLHDEVDVRQIEFARPRQAIIDVLGEANQGCPALVLAEPSRATRHGLPVKEANGMHFMDDHKVIMHYLSLTYGVSRPAHD